MSKMNWSLGPFSLNASRSFASADETSKKVPKTSFRAMRAAAMPGPVRRERRRSMPSARALRSLRSRNRSSTAFCCGPCGGGMNSSLDAIRVGIGDGVSIVASRSHWRTHMAELRGSEVRGGSYRHFNYLRTATPDSRMGSAASRIKRLLRVGRLLSCLVQALPRVLVVGIQVNGLLQVNDRLVWASLVVEHSAEVSVVGRG